MFDMLSPFNLIVLFAITGFLIGTDEGMTMIQYGDEAMSKDVNNVTGGVRGHIGFFWYHAIGIFERLVLLMLGALCFGWILDGRSILFIYGGFFLLWGCLEMGYSYARWLKVMPTRERFDFVVYETILTGKKMKTMIYGRFVVAGILLIIGVI